MKSNELKLECIPNVNVVEYNGSKGYGRGETIIFGYAFFTVEKLIL